MNKLHSILRRPNVTSITASLNKQVAQLRGLADSERARAQALVDKANKAVADADAARKEANQADKVASRIEALVA